MRNGHKLRLLAAATACLMALLPAISMAGEQAEVASATITKTCETRAQDIKPGSTVEFQIRIKVSGDPDQSIDDTMLTDTWSQDLEMEGDPTISDGFKLEKQEAGDNSASYEIQTFYVDEYDTGLVGGSEPVITCTMKVSETAAGTLTNEAVLTGTIAGQPKSWSDRVTVTVVKDKPKAQPKGEAKATAKDESPKTGDPLPMWLLMLLEKIGL